MNAREQTCNIMCAKLFNLKRFRSLPANITMTHQPAKVFHNDYYSFTIICVLCYATILYRQQ